MHGMALTKLVLFLYHPVSNAHFPNMLSRGAASLIHACRPTEEQLRLYSGVLGSSTVCRMLAPSGSDFGDQASRLSASGLHCVRPIAM